MSGQKKGITVHQKIFRDVLKDSIEIELEDNHPAYYSMSISKVSQKLREKWPAPGPCFLKLINIRKKKGRIYLKYGLFEVKGE